MSAAELPEGTGSSPGGPFLRERAHVETVEPPTLNAYYPKSEYHSAPIP